MTKTTNGPAPYAVLILATYKPTGETSSSRFGNYRTEKEALKAIAHNEDYCAKHRINTHTRAYRVFKAEWTELFVADRTLADRTTEQQAAGFKPGVGTIETKA